MSEEDVKRFNAAKNCHICGESFSKNNPPVRDHDHLSPPGKNYRGAACNACNLNHQISFNVPVIAHGSMNYDIHILINAIANKIKGSTKIIPLNSERYVAVIKYLKDTSIRFTFTDSTKFLNSSLYNLSKLLRNDRKIILREHFKDNEEFELVTYKNFFPYDYVSGMEILNEAKLPSRDKFYNQLNDSHISKENYAHALKVFKQFKCKSLQQYALLYQKVDVLILADCFESFRSALLKTHGLDVAHYLTLPSFSFDCCLKHTKVELELLTDIDMMMFFERAVRGGLVQVSSRRAVANNPLVKNYNPDKEKNWIVYLDCNSLYPTVMVEPLPVSGFEFLDDISNFDVMKIPEKSDVGYLIECTVFYPPEIHDKQNDYSMLPIKMKPPNSKQEKLLATLLRKENYVLHYRNLQLAIKHGIILEKTHRVLKFKQTPWMAPYIDVNINLRKQATNDFDKNLYKYLMNSVFGKVLENTRKRSDIRLCTRWEGRYNVEGLISRPNFQRVVSFGDDLAAVQLSKLNIVMDRPIYAGCAILELSKVVMCKFIYEYLQPTFGKGLKIIYSDTDSIVADIKCENIYEHIRRDAEKYYDTSDLKPDNKHGIPLVNKKCLGKFKDEMKGEPVESFAGVRPKSYSIRVSGETEIKRAKGVKKGVIDRCITHDDYIECVERNVELHCTQNFIRSRLHKMYTVREKKLALSPHDNKRFLLKNSFDTLAYGHYKIAIIEKEEMERQENSMMCD